MLQKSCQTTWTWWFLQPKYARFWYCWWKKSQTTTLDVQNPVNNGINYQPQLVIAGFLNHQQYHISSLSLGFHLPILLVKNRVPSHEGKGMFVEKIHPNGVSFYIEKGGRGAQGLYGCFQKSWYPHIIHLFMGFSIIFTIHFGVFPPIFGNIHIVCIYG